MELHQYLEDELFNNKSLGALVYLVEAGREFEFSHKGKSCFISRWESQKEVSLWIDKTEHAFDNITKLIEYKSFEKKSLLEIWEEIEIETLL